MIALRDYQTRALDGVRARMRAGKRAILLVAPTGSGKTLMATEMARGHVARMGRVVWLAHRTELIEHAARTLTAVGIPVGYGAVNPDAPVQIRSVQTLVRRREVPEGTLVIVDECHHMARGGTWGELVRAYLSAKAWLVGLTATPQRADGLPLEGFEALVVAAQIGDLQRAGHLTALRIRRPARLIPTGAMAQQPVDAYLGNARGRSAVVFAPHISAAETFCHAFLALGVQARIVTGKTPPEERALLVRRFAEGDRPVLINVGVLTEGWDAPRCDCVILARSVGSQGLYLQMTGRGLRPFPGKTDCLLLDLRGVSHVLGRPDEDRVYSLDGEGIALTRQPAGTRLCAVCGTPLAVGQVICPDPECGHRNALEIPKATGEALVDWREHAKKDPPDKRVEFLVRQIRTARSRGWKKGAVGMRFRARYGYWPDGMLMETAKRRAG